MCPTAMPLDIDDLLAAISARLGSPRERHSLKVTVESVVQRRLGARWVAILAPEEPAPHGLPAPGDPPLIRVCVPPRPGGRPLDLVVQPAADHQLAPAECRFLERVAAVYALAAGADPAWQRHVKDDGHVRDGAAPLIGHSLAVQALRERIARVAATDFTVLIEGESGSGKELVARQLHELSRRFRGPFVAVNCAAIVETLLEAELFGIEDRTATGVRGRQGKFEQAAGGTLFLDEVADLSGSAQAKLLRAIQDLSVERVGGQGLRRVDTRIIVATNKHLRTLVDQGQFREDLYYRLSGVEVRVPPLRTRREDVAELARYFLDRHRSVRRLELTPAAADALTAYHWPGNVRELERTIESAVTLTRGAQLDLDDLPPAFRGRYTDTLQPSLTERESLREWTGRYVRLVYSRCGGNKREACRILDISYHTLQTYLRQPPGRRRRHEAVGGHGVVPPLAQPGFVCEQASYGSVPDTGDVTAGPRGGEAGARG